MNKLFRELRKENDAQKAREKMEEIKSKQEVMNREIKLMSEELAELSTSPGEIKQGDHVKLKSTQQYGVVDRIQKDKAVVLVGQLQMTLPISELIPSKAPVEVKPHTSIKKDVVDYTHFEGELDIRGMLPEEATRFLERFIDAAFMSSLPHVRIVHGKGTGTLRQLVAKKMRGYPFKEVFHPDKAQGGDGVTIGVL